MMRRHSAQISRKEFLNEGDEKTTAKPSGPRQRRFQETAWFVAVPDWVLPVLRRLTRPLRQRQTWYEELGPSTPRKAAEYFVAERLQVAHDSLSVPGRLLFCGLPAP